MSDRPRPYIPLSVRVQVAERQARTMGDAFWALYEKQVLGSTLSDNRKLRILLPHLFPDGVSYQLDHDPALILRKFRRSNKAPEFWYTPPANHPDFLLYRAGDDHLQKTTGRAPGALRTVTTKGSDIGLKTKFAKLERAPRQKQKIPARKNPWPKRSMRA